MNKDSVSDSERCQDNQGTVSMNSDSNMQTQTLITDTDTNVYVTASVLLEYLFCPRFIYFMNCLCIDQNEDKRFNVLKGREVHEGKVRANIDYLRKII
jgi:CRISPR-associated exonuclease Cas4